MTEPTPPDEARASLFAALAEGDDCPVCKRNVVILCECGQGDPAEHLICQGCGEDPPECDCPAPVVWRGTQAMEQLLVPIGELRPHPTNPRRGDVTAIRDSLRRFGQQRPVLALPDGTLVAGHHVFQAATEEEWTHVAAIRSDLTDAEADAYLLADNRTSDLGYYDDPQLLARLQEVGEPTGTGYTSDDVAMLTESLTTPAELMRAPRGAGPDGQPLAQGTATEFQIVLTFDRDRHRRMTNALAEQQEAGETYADAILRLLEARA